MNGRAARAARPSAIKFSRVRGCGRACPALGTSGMSPLSTLVARSNPHGARNFAPHASPSSARRLQCSALTDAPRVPMSYSRHKDARRSASGVGPKLSCLGLRALCHLGDLWPFARSGEAVRDAEGCAAV